MAQDTREGDEFPLDDEAASAAISELSEAAYMLGQSVLRHDLMQRIGGDPDHKGAAEIDDLRARVRTAERDLAILLDVDWAIDDDETEESP